MVAPNEEREVVSAGARKLTALLEAAIRLFGGAEDGGTSLLRGPRCAAGHAVADAEAVRGRLCAKLSTLSDVALGDDFSGDDERSGCMFGLAGTSALLIAAGSANSSPGWLGGGLNTVRTFDQYIHVGFRVVHFSRFCLERLERRFNANGAHY